MAGPWEKYQQSTSPTEGPWTRYQEQKPEALNTGLGVARDLWEGIPVVGPLVGKGVDWVGSQITGAVTGEDPEKLRTEAEARRNQYREDNPILSTGAQVVGGMAAMAPVAGTAAGAKALGLAGGLAQRAGMGALSGSVISGADSAARGGDLADVGTSALLGGVLGSAGGAAAPYIGRGVQAMGEGAKRMLGMGGQKIAGSELSEPARQILIRALGADGSLGMKGVENVAKAGPNAMLVDSGPSAAALLDTAIQRSGPGARTASQAIEARASQANKDIGAALDTALGQPRGVATTETGIRQGSAGARSAAYEAAYSAPIDYSAAAGRQIEELVKRVPGSAISTANRMMQMEGVKSAQIMAQIADDGTVTYLRMPDVRQIDYITRALNQAAKSGEGQGALGGQTDIGRIYGNLARDLRGATKEAAPDYAKALETAAQPIKAREALRFGEGMMSPSVARDEAKEIISGMTGPERQAAKQGLRSYVDEVLANVRAVASDPNLEAREARKALQDLSSKAAREKISDLIGDEKVAKAMFEQLDEAGTALGLRASVAQGSKTFARLAMDDEVKRSFEDGVGNTLMQGKPINAMQAGVQALTGRTPQGIRGLGDQVYSEVANALVQPRQQAINSLAGLSSLAARRPPTPNYLPGAVAPVANSLADLRK